MTTLCKGHGRAKSLESLGYSSGTTAALRYSMNQAIKTLSVSELASATRSDRVMVKLPGVAVLSQEACQVYATLREIDTVEGILATLRREA